MHALSWVSAGILTLVPKVNLFVLRRGLHDRLSFELLTVELAPYSF